MLTQKNKIIIVDNEESELYRLGKAFLNVGVGCRTILYDITYEEEAFTGVRIAFFDINLTLAKETLSEEDVKDIIEKNGQVFNDLANAINQYISIENGPFALFFWTKNKILVEAFIEYIRHRKIEIANPILIGTLDKIKYTDENIDDLVSEISQLLDSNDQIKFLFDLEETCRKAGEKTLNRLYNISPKDIIFGESTVLFQNLDLIFSKIATSALGFKHAKEDPKKAIFNGLSPILNYEFLNQESAVNWNNVVSKLVNSTKYSDVKIPTPDIQHKINTLYHIENCDENTSKDTRGCVIQIDKSNNKIIESFGISKLENCFNDMIPINESKTRRTLRDNSKLIAVEISAACDYSNKKSRINKYVLGFIVDDFDDTYLDKKRKSDSSYHLGDCAFMIDDLGKQIWLNLNYVFGAKADDERFGRSLFILKKEIIDMLGNKYASHISRIGITSI